MVGNLAEKQLSADLSVKVGGGRNTLCDSRPQIHLQARYPDSRDSLLDVVSHGGSSVLDNPTPPDASFGVASSNTVAGPEL